MTIYECEQLIEILKKSSGGIYIAGAGNYGEFLGNYLNAHNIQWDGFIDIDENKTELCGKKIISYSDIQNRTYTYIIISSIAFTSVICEKLLHEMVKDENIIVFSNADVLIDILNQQSDISAHLSKIEKFKAIHRGKRCFVIGNGPSLTIDDLEHIKNEISFACNSIYALYDATRWRPTYYVLNDSMAVRKILSKETRPKIVGTYDTFFTGISHWNIVKPIEDTLRNVCYFKAVSGIRDGDAAFSGNMGDKLFTVGNITYIMLQLAVFMGFSEIYLLGVDFTFSVEHGADGNIKRNDVINHNALIEKEEEKYEDMIKKNMGGYEYWAEIDYQLWGYQAAKRYADSHGINIYNATRGGKLEVFPRVDFDSLF